MADKHDDSSQPEISIYRLEIHLDLEDNSDATLSVIKLKYGQAIDRRFGIVFLDPEWPHLDLIDYFFIDRVNKIVKRFSRNNGITMYIADMVEYQESWAHVGKLVVETFITHHHIEEAIEELRKKLEEELKQPGITVKVPKPTPSNIPSQRTTRHNVRLLRVKISALQVLSYGAPTLSMLCLAIWFWGTITEERERKEPQKIDVTIKSEGPLPITIQPSTRDTTIANQPHAVTSPTKKGKYKPE